MFKHKYRKQLSIGQFDYYDVKSAISGLCIDTNINAYEKLPYSYRILAEQLLRHSDDGVDDGVIEKQLLALVNDNKSFELPWYPTRIVCHDILGLTALVDLAGLREVIAKQGGDPRKVNPVVPTQLIVDHSLSVEYDGSDSNAFVKNRAIEDSRNDDRFDFINWAKQAFTNVNVIPAGNGIMHQINLEKMSPVIQTEQGLAFPDTCIGTDSHTPHVSALGVLALGVGGLEAESVMLGRPSMMKLPKVVAVKLNGKPQSGITATDIALDLTQFLRSENVLSSYLEFIGEGVKYLTIGDRATITNMTPEYGASASIFYIDQQTLDYLTLTGRDNNTVKLVECYAKALGLWYDDFTKSLYSKTLSFDLSRVTRNISGPKNPHHKIPPAGHYIRKTRLQP